MTPRRRYLAGLGIVAGSSLLLALALGRGDARRTVLLVAALALAVQAPLGWWLVRSLGTPRFTGVWVAGMAGRVALIGVTAFVLVPAFGWPLGPALFGLAGMLVGLLLVEVLVVMRAGRPNVEAR